MPMLVAAHTCRHFAALALIGLTAAAGIARSQPVAWGNYAGDPQHTALAPAASQALGGIRWQTPVDLNPQYTGGGSLLAHYGSPVITGGDTVIVPVKTRAGDGLP